ncbi:hypothetical protein JCM10914_4180 [Paenibacillus sp. JCM 10914]|nr:hypothetical protein JCM10914_4180 [Paenibacillus sp. JCM 10914]
MYSDWMFLLIIIAFIFSLWAQFRVKGTFKKWAVVENSTGLTGYDAARRMLDANGLHDVPIEPVPGTLSDHYDPTKRVVRLSEPVYYERSISRSQLPVTRWAMQFSMPNTIRCWSLVTECSRSLTLHPVSHHFS